MIDFVWDCIKLLSGEPWPDLDFFGVGLRPLVISFGTIWASFASVWDPIRLRSGKLCPVYIFFGIVIGPLANYFGTLSAAFGSVWDSIGRRSGGRKKNRKRQGNQ